MAESEPATRESVVRVPFRVRHYLLLVFIVLVVVTVLSGCGGKGGGY
jgi:hypothetical protein